MTRATRRVTALAVFWSSIAISSALLAWGRGGIVGLRK